MKANLEHMMENQDGTEEVRHLRRNFEETHIEMRENLKRSLDTYLYPLLEVK